MFKYSQEFLDQLILDIYNGIVTVENLPINLYQAISEYLISAFDKIEGKASQSLLSALSTNVHEFSAAKVYQQINEISLVKDSEAIKSFAAFKDEALQIYDKYNLNWLQTEYSTAIAQSQNAVRWEQIQDQKKTLPYLQYSAVLDSQTSEICAPLDGICLPVDDAFWATNAPENHWNCRCLLIQLDDLDAVVTSQEDASKADAETSELRQPMFANNVGMTGQIFPKDHPYFNTNGE
ncbi:MAG: minor capsid protein [Bacteroidia bacterium]|nr:minor capsid protein [Bacteroidia bacterium]